METQPAPKVKPEDEPHRDLILARRFLKRWDLERASSGSQSWIETTGTKKRIWLILRDADGNTNFEEV